MKTVTFSKHPTDLSHQQPQANQDEKYGGRHHTLEMTTEVSSPSAQTWLENFDTDQGKMRVKFTSRRRYDCSRITIESIPVTGTTL